MGSPLVEQFKKGGVSRDVRLTAASGALPLTPSDQAELLYLLTRDQDDEVRTMAESSLLEVGEDDLVAVLKDRGTPPQVLHFFGVRTRSPDVQQVIVRNQSTENQTILKMVPGLDGSNLEFLVINQTRMLKLLPIIKALEDHPDLSADQRRRLDELKHDFKLDQPEAQEPPPPVPEEPSLVNYEEGPPEVDETPTSKSVEEVMESVVQDAATEEEQETLVNTFGRIVKMSPAEKMIEALKGNRESRMLLIRDRNRVVYNAVLSSPKITDSEIEAIASMRNISPEVLRNLGGKREWTKRYTIAHELVKNPLTPIAVSMGLMNRLAPRDLKKLTRDRNVPEMIRRHATKMVRSPAR